MRVLGGGGSTRVLDKVEPWALRHKLRLALVAGWEIDVTETRASGAHRGSVGAGAGLRERYQLLPVVARRSRRSYSSLEHVRRHGQRRRPGASSGRRSRLRRPGQWREWHNGHHREATRDSKHCADGLVCLAWEPAFAALGTQRGNVPTATRLNRSGTAAQARDAPVLVRAAPTPRRRFWPHQESHVSDVRRAVPSSPQSAV